MNLVLVKALATSISGLCSQLLTELADGAPPLPTPVPPLPPLPPADTGPRNGWDACSSMLVVASREGWPGHAGRPFDRFDYVRGIEGLYVGAGRREDPIFEGRPDQLEADIRDLCRSDKGRAWLADPENRARTGVFYVRLAGFRPVERLPDGTLREYEGPTANGGGGPGEER